MFNNRKFIKKTTKFDRRNKKAPDMALIRQNTPNLEERPFLYLKQALEKLNLPPPVGDKIIQLFEMIKIRIRYFERDPMPLLSGIIYYGCKRYFMRINRENVAALFGINKEMVTVGYKLVNSLVSDYNLSQKDSSKTF